jgi:hypothetical protein
MEEVIIKFENVSWIREGTATLKGSPSVARAGIWSADLPKVECLN